MDHITLPNQEEISYTYDSAGNVTRVDYPNGTYTTYFYDTRNRLLTLTNYGPAEASGEGAWEIDHVIQKGKGGPKDPSNCLSACVKCNRLRWHRTGQEVRDLLLYGLIVRDEIKKGTQVGKTIEDLKEKRLKANLSRRRKVVK